MKKPLPIVPILVFILLAGGYLYYLASSANGEIANHTAVFNSPTAQWGLNALLVVVILSAILNSRRSNGK